MHNSTVENSNCFLCWNLATWLVDKKQVSVTHHRKGFSLLREITCAHGSIKGFCQAMRCWLKTYCSISHPSLKVVQNCTWIWAVDETTITRWTMRRRKRRRRDLNNFLYILHVNDLWRVGLLNLVTQIQHFAEGGEVFATCK